MMDAAKHRHGRRQSRDVGAPRPKQHVPAPSDLLASLIGYGTTTRRSATIFWPVHRGPAGATVDEARHEATTELELALGVSRELGARPMAPWLTEAFAATARGRDGNTHRTEVCIDKLYSPDSATGRWAC